MLGGCDEISEIETLYKELNSLLNLSGFRPHKLFSNFTQLLNDISSSENCESYNSNLDDSANKVLGLKWNPTADTLSFLIPQRALQKSITKRKILSIVAQCFDPLGLVSLSGNCYWKIINSKLGIEKLNWDTEVTDQGILNDWSSWLQNLHFLSEVKILIYLFLNKSIKQIEFHGFSDASMKACMACVYVRTEYSDGYVSL